MSTRPEMIRQFAQHLASEVDTDGHGGVEVYAQAEASLNGREQQALIDPGVDLAREPLRLGPAPWILSLREPLSAVGSPEVPSEHEGSH